MANDEVRLPFDAVRGMSYERLCSGSSARIWVTVRGCPFSLTEICQPESQFQTLM